MKVGVVKYQTTHPANVSEQLGSGYGFDKIEMITFENSNLLNEKIRRYKRNILGTGAFGY